MARPTRQTASAGHAYQLHHWANGDSRARYIRREFFKKQHSIIVSPAEQFSCSIASLWQPEQFSSIASLWQLRSNLSNNQGVIVCNNQGVVVFDDEGVNCRNYRNLLYNLTIRMTNKFTLYVLLWLSFITIPQYPTVGLGEGYIKFMFDLKNSVIKITPWIRMEHNTVCKVIWIHICISIVMAG
jgi:hypothetical protein